MDAARRGLAPGMTVGTCRLERLLGRGGTGAVFLAYDTRLHRHVALKVLDRDAADTTSSARLLHEARNAAALNHPHICTIHEVGDADGTAFIAMEFVEGRSLRERVDEGALPLDEAVRLGIQAADALAYAHEHGVVHRDFKAANAIPADQNRLAAVRPVNPEAYEAYLKGRIQWQTMTPRGLDAAMGYFELAAQKDPNYAAPYTGMGTVWGLRCSNDAMRCREAATKWKEAVQRAEELEPDAPLVQAQIAAIAFYVDWDWPAAEREFRRAIEVDAGNPDVHMWYADYLMNVAGRVDDAIAEARRAVELDPQNSLYRVRLAVAFMDAHREDDAIAVLEQVLKADPGMRQAQINLVQAFAAKGMYKDAVTMMAQNNANDPALVEAQQRAYQEGGFPRVARIRPDALVRQSQTGYVSPGGIAAAYARAGEVALALDYLEKAYEERETMMVSLKGGRAWDAVRGEPRFEAILRQMNLSR